MAWFAARSRSGWGAAALTLLLLQGSLIGQTPAPNPEPALPLSPVASGPPLSLPPPTLTISSDMPNNTLPETITAAEAAAAPVLGGPSPLPTLQPPSSGPGADTTPLNDYWRNGIRFESKDKNFSIFMGGRFQFDVVDYIATDKIRNNIPGTNRLEDGVTFRRIRFDMGGTIYKNIEYFAQVDFANGFLASANESTLTNSTYPTDMWVQWKDLPYNLGTIRVGNQKPLYSFEHLVSSRFLPFLERSLGFDAFVEHFDNGFEPGISIFNTYDDKHGTWGLGVMKTTRNPFGWNVGRGEVEENGRVTFLPIDECGGKYLLHLGVGAANRQTDQDQVRYRSRLDARNSPSTFSPLIADTGLFFSTTQQLLIPELAAVCGPWTLQSEYYGSWAQNAANAVAGQRGPNMGTVFMQSAYAEVGYFLTGEHREYNRDTGVFTRVVPKRPLAWTKTGFTGWGAWQVMSRYSYLDLNDKDVRGGRVHDMTLGLNWFMNPNLKLQANYFLAHRDVRDVNGDGFIQGFAIRTAIDW